MPNVGDTRDITPTVAQLQRMCAIVNKKGRVRRPDRAFTYTSKLQDRRKRIGLDENGFRTVTVEAVEDDLASSSATGLLF